MYTVSEAVEKLAAMGSPDQIAMELETQGIKGCRWGGNSCAIAEYVKVNASVTGSDYVHVSPIAGVTVGNKNHAVSQEVKRFIIDFDDGRYPNLIAEDA